MIERGNVIKREIEDESCYKDKSIEDEYGVYLSQVVENISRLINKTNITPQEMSYLIETDPSYVYGLFRRSKKPGMKIIYRIAKALNCSIYDIIPDINDNREQQIRQCEIRKQFFELTKDLKESELKLIFEIINSYKKYSNNSFDD